MPLYLFDMKGVTMRSFFAIALLSAACVDQTSQPAPAPSEITLETGKGVDVETEKWNPLIANEYTYWPPGAVHVQVISTNGDDDGTGHPTTYVYIVKNGSVVFHIFRALKTDLVALNNTINAAALGVEQANPLTYHINTTGGFTGTGPHSPPAPGGDGEVVIRGWFNQIILDMASQMGGAMNNILNNMNTPEYRGME
jgi:hypothetical protein